MLQTMRILIGNKKWQHNLSHFSLVTDLNNFWAWNTATANTVEWFCYVIPRYTKVLWHGVLHRMWTNPNGLYKLCMKAVLFSNWLYRLSISCISLCPGSQNLCKHLQNLLNKQYKSHNQDNFSLTWHNQASRLVVEHEA